MAAWLFLVAFHTLIAVRVDALKSKQLYAIAGTDNGTSAATRLQVARKVENARVAALGQAAAAAEKAAMVQGAAPVPPLSQPGDGTELIFEVSAFQDGQRCGRTLFYAFGRAARPGRISVYVLQARGDEDRDCLHSFKTEYLDRLCEQDGFWEQMQVRSAGNRSLLGRGGKRSVQTCRDSVLRRIHAWAIHPSEAKGPVHQRGLANLLLKYESPEAMCLSTDSHMAFWQEWDRLLIQEWLATRNEFAVLTAYPWNLGSMNDSPNTSFRFPTFCGYEHETSGMEHGMPRARGIGIGARVPGIKPYLTMNWAAGFSFHRCHAEKAVPADVHLKWMFSGEEANRAVRLWTHGYDLYIPTLPMVVHDYSNAKQGFWAFQMGEEERMKSQSRLAELMGLQNRPKPSEPILEPYTLGAQRTLEDFVRWSREDFGDAWGPWLEEQGLHRNGGSDSFCKSLPRMPVKDEAALVAAIGSVPPARGAARLSAFPRGRLEIFDGKSWGTVCGSPWDSSDGAARLCQKLGYSGGTGFLFGDAYAIGVDELPIVSGNRRCTDHEESILSCPLRSVELETCTHAQDYGVHCEEAVPIRKRGKDDFDADTPWVNLGEVAPVPLH